MFYFVEQPFYYIAIAMRNEHDGLEGTDIICAFSSEVLSLVVIFVDPPLKIWWGEFLKNL